MRVRTEGPKAPVEVDAVAGSGMALGGAVDRGDAGVIRADRAAELLTLARDYVGANEAARLARACEEKSARLRTLLGRSGVTPEALAEALRLVFAAGRARRRVGGAGWREAVAALALAVESLLDPAAGGCAARRIDLFAREAEAVLGEAAPAVGADLLRFCRPDLAWPWAPWVWDGAAGGVVGHVRAAPTCPDLAGDAGATGGGEAGGAGPPPGNPGRVYAQAGRHLAYLRALWAESVPVDGFALDAWLAAAFAAHAYLVTSVSATEELAGFLPGPAELAARLLGVWSLAGAGGAEAAAAQGRGIAR